MSGYKEFEGKTLDEAIRDACAYYDATRDKLEIDILNDAKGGIFGLMGAKKARVRARLVELSSVLEGLDSLNDKGKASKKRPDAHGGESRRTDRRDVRDETPRQERPAPAPSRNSEPSPETARPETPSVSAASPTEGQTASRPARPSRPPRKERAREGRRARHPGGGTGHEQAGDGAHAELLSGVPLDIAVADPDLDGEEFSRVPVDQLDAAALESAVREMVSRLTMPFLGEVTITVAITNDRVRVTLTGVEDPGLLIGRDGQTLASLQYLVTRMLSNRMKALLRVQIDAGDYRERQDERLREMALSLAEKVKAGGRPQVTRPLSSYHRRVIHLTLQDDPLIQTHSKGEGEMKRVMVTRRKPEKNA